MITKELQTTEEILSVLRDNWNDNDEVDLIGLEVFSDEGSKLGNLIDVFPTGSNDVYVVKDDLGKQILLPAISKVIKSIVIENEKIVVDKEYIDEV